MSSTIHQKLPILLLMYYSCSYIRIAADGKSTIQCLPDQSSSLLQLKRSFHNDPNLSSWQDRTDCCHWDGVTCDTLTGQVISLDLGGRYLESAGGFSPALFNLTSLKNLSLAANNFRQANLPTIGFEKLTELVSLELYETNIFGQIPIAFARLKKLQKLDLSYNYNLYFREPSFQMIVGNLSNLRYLGLIGVDMFTSGETWSITLAKHVPRLQYLSLYQSQLSGYIHHSFSQLQYLIKMDLGENDLEGQFPTEILQLKSLRFLDVSGNTRLCGHLPNFPAENHLEYLNLLGTNFSDDIPASLVNLKFLQSLGFSIKTHNESNSLIGNLLSLSDLTLDGSGTTLKMSANFSWIVNLKNLVSLGLCNYSFSGPIPPWFSNLTHLTGLTISYCNLSGPVPSLIGNMTQLELLDLTYNSLDGNIPKYFFTLPALEYLNLRSNQLSGNLEDIRAPFSSSMSEIDLSYNLLTGIIPKSLFEMISLQYLNLESNHFTGIVELNLLQSLKNLEVLVLSDNMLSVIDGEGPQPSHPSIMQLYLASCNLTKFPAMLRYQYNMLDIDLACNQISGVIPGWIWENSKDILHALNLSHNMFTGLENNPSIIQMRGLSSLDLSSNRLQGNVPIPRNSINEGIILDYSNNSFSFVTPDFGNLTEIIYLDLSKNKLEGHIPVSVCNLRYLEVFDLSYNNFSGPVPSCLIEGDRLSILKLRENQFYGILPDNFSEDCVLRTIDLNINQIEGKLPRSLSKCRSLEVLDAGNNHIIDSFPSWLGNLPNLRVLVLRSNHLYGSIGGNSESVGPGKHFSGLQILDLGSNNFSQGLHPAWFTKLDTMKENSSNEVYALGATSLMREYYQDSVIVTFKGLDLTFTKILTTFKMIDLSNNSLEGKIPESIGTLIALHGLNMSHNNFTGRIPSKLGDLAQLESLDLSSNQISGTIPQELASLTSLAILNLSYNNLTGQIPQGPQFLSFGNRSFEGNAGLCGRPLSKQCNDSGKEATGSSASSLDSMGIIILFVFVGSGFGIGFTVAIVLSVVSRAKRWNWNVSRFTSNTVVV